MSRSKAVVLAGAPKRSRWREEEARAIVNAWRASGMTQAEFSRTQDVHVMRLSRWARRLGAEPANVTSFREVRVRENGAARVGPGMEVVLCSGCIIRVPPGFATEDLRRVLDAVERA